MAKKLLFAVGAALGFLVIESHYMTGLLIGIALGTIVLTIITVIVGLKNANIWNSFLLATGWIAIIEIVALFPLHPALAFAIVLAGAFALIKLLYGMPGARPLILLTLSMIIRRSLGFMIVPYLAEIARLVIF